MKCGVCHCEGHGAWTCPKRIEATVTIQVPADGAEVIWRERLYGIWRAATYDDNPIKSAMLSAYLQGALDAQRPEIAQVVHT